MQAGEDQVLQGIEEPVLPSAANDLPDRHHDEHHDRSNVPDRCRDELRAGCELLPSVVLELPPNFVLEVPPGVVHEVLSAEDHLLFGDVDYRAVLCRSERDFARGQGSSGSAAGRAGSGSEGLVFRQRHGHWLIAR